MSVAGTASGARVVRVATADETAAACPRCGVFSTRVKEYVTTRPRDLPRGRDRVLVEWRKRRWYCRERLCPRTSFTESVPAVPAGARITTRLREHAGALVVDGHCATVAAASRLTGVSWPTVMDAVREGAERVLEDEAGAVEVLGIDEVRRGRPRWRPAEPVQPSPPIVAEPLAPQPLVPESAVASAAPEPIAAEPVAPEPVAAGPVVPQGEPARARVLADRWHVGFTDIGGGQGMLGQVEGRTGDDVAYWLAQHAPAWRDRIRYVAIDMCTVFVSAIRRYLPNATIVVDHFHIVKLANDTVAEVRRRIATQLRGRRGRATDPEYTVRTLLRRNREDLSERAFTKLWNTLVDLGAPGATILKTWIAKEELRRLLALAGTGTDRSVISHRLYRFYTWCADAAVPELERLAATIETWWPAILAFLHTKITNAKSEGYNRVVKLDARNAYGYRNPANQRLRTRCATTRRARGCLNPDQPRLARLIECRLSRNLSFSHELVTADVMGGQDRETPDRTAAATGPFSDALDQSQTVATSPPSNDRCRVDSGMSG
jgi:transposase